MTLAEHPELFARVAEDPFDDARWLVLEDWLLERDDPRASLVKLEKANKSTKAALAKLWPAYANLDASWRAGFVTALVLVPADEVNFASPAFRFLRSVDFAFAERRRLMEELVAIAKLPCVRTVRVQGEVVPPLDEIELASPYEILLAAFELEDAVGGVVSGEYSQVEALVKALDALGINVRRGYLPAVEDLIDAVLERKEIAMHPAALEVAMMATQYVAHRSNVTEAMAHGLRTVIEDLFDDHFNVSSPFAVDLLYRIELSLLRPKSRPLPARSRRGPRPSRP